MPFSFFNADLAVWLENPGEWRIQFAAQPARTDLSLDLADTGVLRLDGSLRRAPTLSEMPAKLHAEWSSAPLGQLSRIFMGSDADWRGDLDATADVAGTLSSADIKLVARGQGIHRIEFEPRESLNIELTCQARFGRGERALDHHLDRFFDAITCLLPTGGGHLLLTGNIHGLSRQIDPTLSLEVNNMPAATAFDGLRLMRSGFAPELQATGAINGNFIYASSGASVNPQFSGQAVVNPLTIAAPALEKPLTLPAVRFEINTEPTSNSNRRSRALRGQQPIVAQTEPTLLLEPFALVASPALRSSLNVSGAFTRSAFSVHVAGQSRLGQLASLGREFRLLRNRNVSFGPPGTADVDVNIHGPWVMPVSDSERPVAPATIDGIVHLRNATLTASFLAQPLQIGSAQAILSDNTINWTASSFAYGPIHGDGSLSYPIFCVTAECDRQFTLHIASLDASTAQKALLGGQRHGELVEQLLSRIGPGDAAWPALSGTVQIGALTVSDLTLHDVVAAVAVKNNIAEVTSLTARALEGSLRLSGSLEVSNGTPRYEIDADLDHASIAAAAAIFQEKWGSGAIHLQTKLHFSGFESDQLVSSTTGSFHWDWTAGGLPLIGPSKSDPLQSALAHFDSWTADGTFGKEHLEIERSAITAAGNVVPLAGTIGFDRQLKLQNPDPGAALRITGTLEKPEVTSGPMKTASIP